MEQQIKEVKSYIEEYSIKEYEILEVNNHMGHTIYIRWKQDDIPCEKRIFKTDDAMLRMAEHFHTIKNVLRGKFIK
jgi:acyl-ACP thioesterase